MIWQVLDRYSYDGPLTGHGYDLRCFQKQVLTFLLNVDPLAKKSLCLYDDLGQLGKNDLIDLIVARYGSILLEDGVEKAVLEKIRNAYTNEARFRKDRVILFNLTRESPLYDSKEFSQLLETISDGSFLEGGWDGVFPWVIVFGNKPILYTATTAALGGRILFYKLNSQEHRLVFDRDLAKKVAALAANAADISLITDESSSTGRDPKVIAFERTFESSGTRGRKAQYIEYTDLIDHLVNSYSTLFKGYRKWGKKPKVGIEGWVYEKTAFHKFFLDNFEGKIHFSEPGGVWTYYVKAKKA